MNCVVCQTEETLRHFIQIVEGKLHTESYCPEHVATFGLNPYVVLGLTNGKWSEVSSRWLLVLD